MNSLDKIQAGLLLVAILLFSSCNDDSGALELEIDNSTDVEVVNFTFPSQTIYFDSLRTDNSPYILIGKYQDNELGSLEASSYVTLRFESRGEITSEARYDSAFIQMEVQNLAGNSVSGLFNLHQLTEPLYNTAIYTSDKSLEFEVDPAETIEVNLSTLAGDTLFQARADSIGMRLFESIKDSVVFPGYVERYIIKPTEDFQNLVSFNLNSASTRLVIFSSSPDSTVYQSVFSLNDKHFTNIEKDFSATNFQSIKNLDTVQLNSGVNKVAPLFGFYTAADVTQLIEFAQNQPNILVNKAEITIEGDSQENESLNRLQFFFYKPGIGFSGEGIIGSGASGLSRWINNAILDNETYFAPNPSSITAIAELREERYIADITIFADIYFSEILDQDNVLTRGIVITPTSFLDFRDASLRSDPNVRIYYTTIQD